MRFAFICPIRYLDEITSLGTIKLCLAHLLEVQSYSSYFKASRENGDFIILDNGVVERGEPLDAETLYSLVEELRPQEVVAPDVLHDADETVRRTLDFVKNFPPDLRTLTRIMGVVQGQTLGAMMECYETIKDVVDVIGVPFACDFETKSQIALSQQRAMNRLSFLSWLRRQSDVKAVHCLGMNSVSEALAISKLKFVRSMDSSFVWTHTRHAGFFWMLPNVNKIPSVKFDPFEVVSDESYIIDVKRNVYFIKALVGDV